MSARRLALAFLLVACASGGADAQRSVPQLWASAGLGAAARTAAVAGVVGTSSGAIPIGEAGLRYRALSLRARFGGGEFTSDSGTTASATVSSAEVLIGAAYRGLSAEAGLGQRRLQGSLTTRQWLYKVAGVRAECPLGASGVTAGAAVHAWIDGKEAVGDVTASGLAGETYLLARPWTSPIYLRLSYRVEAFSDDGADPFPDRAGMLGLGLGFSLGPAVAGRGPSSR